MDTKTAKFVRGVVIAGAGAALAYAAGHLGDIDLGSYGPALAAVLSKEAK